MYAVANVHFERTVDVSLLCARLAPPTVPAVAVAATIFATKTTVVVTTVTAATVYAHLNQSAVCLMSIQGPKQLELHIECVRTPESISELKYDVSRFLVNLLDAAVESGQETDCVDVVIYTGTAVRITSGRYQPFWEVMGTRFKDTIIGDVLLAAVPAVTGLSFGLDAKQAAITFGSTIIAVFIWICIEANRRQKVLVYEDL